MPHFLLTVVINFVIVIVPHFIAVVINFIIVTVPRCDSASFFFTVVINFCNCDSARV